MHETARGNQRPIRSTRLSRKCPSLRARVSDKFQHSQRYSCAFDMTLRCSVGNQVFLNLCKLRNHLQCGGSPYSPASHRTKAVKPTIKNCPKVRSRRTVNLVLCTNRPRCCAWGHRNEKLVVKCDRDSKNVERCRNPTLSLLQWLLLTETGKTLRCHVRNEADLIAGPSALKKIWPEPMGARASERGKCVWGALPARGSAY